MGGLYSYLVILRVHCIFLMQASICVVWKAHTAVLGIIWKEQENFSQNFHLSANYTNKKIDAEKSKVKSKG